MQAFLSNYFFVILAIMAGLAMPTQATVNSKLAESVQSPILAAFVSFVVGTVTLFAYILLSGQSLANLADLKNAPPVAWIGGFLGVFFVAVMATVVPKIGGALAFSLAIVGQMFVTFLIDHFGWLGVPEKPISLPRIFGGILVIIGVVLIRKF